jgi:RpiR family carbohydrate utilization transcriptional regulator
LTDTWTEANLEKKFFTYNDFKLIREKIFAMSDFIHNLQAHYPNLRKSEQVIADYLQEHAGERLDLTITELARTLEVSETTISRFCRVIGYAGFQDLKLSMATAASNTESFQNIPAEIREDDPAAVISKKLAESLRRSIGQTQQGLNMGPLQAAIDALAGASQIVLFGVGGSAVITAALHHLFTKAGINCMAYSDGYMQNVSASMLGKGAVALGVSNTGGSKHVVDALKIAAEQGATTIGITSNPDSELANASEICLTTPLKSQDAPLYGGSIDAKVCQLYLADLLYLGVLFKLGAPAKRSLKKTAQVLRSYYNPSSSSGGDAE